MAVVKEQTHRKRNIALLNVLAAKNIGYLENLTLCT
jgi:hypothetical protein